MEGPSTPSGVPAERSGVPGGGVLGVGAAGPFAGSSQGDDVLTRAGPVAVRASWFGVTSWRPSESRTPTQADLDMAGIESDDKTRRLIAIRANRTYNRVVLTLAGTVPTGIAAMVWSLKEGQYPVTAISFIVCAGGILIGSPIAARITARRKTHEIDRPDSPVVVVSNLEAEPGLPARTRQRNQKTSRKRRARKRKSGRR